MLKVNKILKQRLLKKSFKERYNINLYGSFFYKNLHYYWLDKIKYQVNEELVWVEAETYYVKKYIIYCFNEFGEKYNSFKHDEVIRK
jgi:hypothetical protein